MFWALLVAQCANETHVTSNRIIASLLRSESVSAFLSRAQIDAARLLEAVDDPQLLSFEECERRIHAELALNEIVLGSEEHRGRVQLRPLDPVAREVMNKVIERYGHVGVSPLELLREMLRADSVLASRLAPYGLDAEAVNSK